MSVGDSIENLGVQLLVRQNTVHRFGSLARSEVKAMLDLRSQEDAIGLATPQIGLRDDRRIRGVLEAWAAVEFEVKSVNLTERPDFVGSDPA